MKKYLAIVRCVKCNFYGARVWLVARPGDTKEYLNKWMESLPYKDKFTIINNSEELQEIFTYFMEYTPVTEEEKKEMEKTKRIYEKIMGKHDD